jgi:anti-anti-sigma factor
MGETSRLSIPARLEEVRHACEFVVEAAEIAGLDERAVYHCQMAVDEALTNIIEHGFAYQDNDSQIDIICQVESGQFLINIVDDSPAFNPLEHETPDPSEPLDSREPGGWGIYFIRKLMDDVGYEHRDDRNRLTLVKNLPTLEPAVASSEDAESAFPVRSLEKNGVVIIPSGRLDSNTSPRLERTLNGQLEKGHYWLFVDMGEVEYIASSGLKVLVSSWRRAHEHDGDVILIEPQPRIVEILEMVGFDMLFEIFPNLDDAQAAQAQKR